MWVQSDVQIGQVVAIGQPLMAVTQNKKTWVIANFKETQIQNMRVGQAVEEYYGFVIRRLAEQGELPKGFSAPIPPPPGPRVRTAGER